jgi:elongation factor G
MAVEPRTKADSDKMAVGLDRLSDEDPTFVVKTDEETGQTIIAGMGELHLEVIIDRLKREFGVQANVGKPQIAYRETVSTTAEGDGKFIRDGALGGKAAYGHVILSLSPNKQGEGVTTEDKASASDFPKEYIPAVMKGIEEALTNGLVAGFPVVDVNASVTGGSFHEVDSNDNAFKIAAIFAIKEALKQHLPFFLSPSWMSQSRLPMNFREISWVTSTAVAVRSKRSRPKAPSPMFPQPSRSPKCSDIPRTSAPFHQVVLPIRWSQNASRKCHAT